MQEFLRIATDFGKKITELEVSGADKNTVAREMILFELKKRDEELHKHYETDLGKREFKDLWSDSERQRVIKEAVSTEEGWAAWVKAEKSRLVEVKELLDIKPNQVIAEVVAEVVAIRKLKGKNLVYPIRQPEFDILKDAYRQWLSAAIISPECYAGEIENLEGRLLDDEAMEMYKIIVAGL